MTKTILVIDDETALRENLCELLRFEDFRTLQAGGGAAGLEYARAHQPDLIICDIMMPDLDGFAVLEALREGADTSHIPVILLTAKTEKSAVQQGVALGANAFVKKPFTGEEILGAIRDVLG